MTHLSTSASFLWNPPTRLLSPWVSLASLSLPLPSTFFPTPTPTNSSLSNRLHSILTPSPTAANPTVFTAPSSIVHSNNVMWGVGWTKRPKLCFPTLAETLKTDIYTNEILKCLQTIIRSIILTGSEGRGISFQFLIQLFQNFLEIIHDTVQTDWSSNI